MHYCSMELEKFDDVANNDYKYEEYVTVDPRDILQRGWERLNDDVKSEVRAHPCISPV